MQPPILLKKTQVFENHGIKRQDDYYWIRDKANPQVISYLEAENAYTQSVLAHTDAFKQKIFEELKGREKLTDMSVPYRRDDYLYYHRTEEDKEYPIFCRKTLLENAEEEIMLDVNELAKGHDYYHVSGTYVSPNQQIMAYLEDLSGDRKNNLHFKNLETGAFLPDTIAEMDNFTWFNDNQTYLYGVFDDALRLHKIFKHRLGAAPDQAIEVFHEPNEACYIYTFRSRSKRFIYVVSQSKTSIETHFMDANLPDSDWTLLQKRTKNVRYHTYHYGDYFYILTNWEATNFRVMRTLIDSPSMENWEEVIPLRENVFIEYLHFFKDYMVLVERENGLEHIRIKAMNGTADYYLPFNDPAYSCSLQANHTFDSKVVRYAYNSLTTPYSVYEFNMDTQEKNLLKQEEVLGGFSSENYASERFFATAQDGTQVPISLVYRKGMVQNGTHPLLLDGYGAYGYSFSPNFDSNVLTLLDRGFIYAIAHVRGGEDMGRQWYEDGKFLKKKNTFTDFIACAEHLIAQQYTQSEKLLATGGSAGGLLMGAVINLRPELFKGIVANVPFVDVVTTMLDTSIPLTTGEYEEWGNPNEKAYFEYMLSYSPYDNVERKTYPAMLVLAGLHDSQVHYWEPAKWVAKLRAYKTDDNILLLKTNMKAGHGGASGRFEAYKELAFEYVFMLDLLGIKE